MIGRLDDLCKWRLASGQVIRSVVDIVKELIENSLDANSRSISITLVNDGWDKIMLKDDGEGIPWDGRDQMGIRYATSKITSYDDLECVRTLGFRGEALHSICCCSKSVTITTRTDNEQTGTVYELNNDGSVNSLCPASAQTRGTMVEVYKPFHNFPVRREHGQRSSKRNEVNVKDLMIQFSIVNHHVRFALQVKGTGVDKMTVFPASNGHLSALTNAIGKNAVQRCFEYKTVEFDAILPRPGYFNSFTSKSFFYINGRPLSNTTEEIKSLVKIFRMQFEETCKRPMFCFVNIRLPMSKYDVNLEPSKDRVLFHDFELVKKDFESMVRDAYEHLQIDKENINVNDENHRKQNQDLNPYSSQVCTNIPGQELPRGSPTAPGSSIDHAKDTETFFVHNMFDLVDDIEPTEFVEQNENMNIENNQVNEISSTANPWTFSKLIPIKPAINSENFVTNDQTSPKLIPKKPFVNTGKVSKSDNFHEPKSKTKTKFMHTPTPPLEPTHVPKRQCTSRPINDSSPIKPILGIEKYFLKSIGNPRMTPPRTPKINELSSSPNFYPLISPFDTRKKQPQDIRKKPFHNTHQALLNARKQLSHQSLLDTRQSPLDTYQLPLDTYQSPLDTLDLMKTLPLHIRPRHHIIPLVAVISFDNSPLPSDCEWTFFISKIKISRFKNCIIAHTDTRAICICRFDL